MTDTELAVAGSSELQRARRTAGDGRLRHRLFVAELPQPLPARHPEDGPVAARRRRIAGDLRARAAVLGLGETFQLEVVAEGIEYPEQSATLRELGCETGQGFYFARPMEPDRLVSSSRREPATARRHGAAGRLRLSRCNTATRGWTGRAASAASGCSPRWPSRLPAAGGGMSVSLLGDGLFLVALAWQVYALSNAPTALATRRHRDDGADDRVPADRRRGQRPLRSPPGDACRRLRARGGAGGARGLTVTGALVFWQLLAIAVVYGAATAFFDPASDALVPRAAPRGGACSGQLARPADPPVGAAARRPRARGRARRRDRRRLDVRDSTPRRSRSQSPRSSRCRPRRRRGAGGPIGCARDRRRAALRPQPRLAVGDAGQRRDRLPAVHGTRPRCCCPFIVKNRSARRRAGPGPGVRRRRARLAGMRAGDRPARAARAAHDLHLRRVDGRHARGRRLRHRARACGA